MIRLILLIISFVGGQILSVNFSNIRISALDLSVGIFIIWALLQRKLQVRPVKRYLKIFGLFIFVCLISLIFQLKNLDFLKIIISSLYLWRFVMYSLLAIFISQDKKIKHLSIWGLWWGGVTIALLGLIQYFLYPNLRNLQYLGWDPHQYRIFSTLLDPNFTGIILVLTLILGMYLFNTQKQKKVIIAGEIISFIALLLTYSRGSYLALIIGIFVMVMLNKKIRLIWRIGLIGIFGIVFMGLLFLLPHPGGEGVNLLRVISVESRIENSQEAIELFIKSPIIGYGFNTLRYFRSGFDEYSQSVSGFHNSWLFILVTTGILGLLSYIWIWWNILKTLYCSSPSTSLREDNKNFSLDISSGSKNILLLISFIAIFIHSQFDNSLFYPYVMFWMFMLVGSFSITD